jgi:hypothetical protein
MPYVGPPFEHDIFFSYAHGVSIRDIAPLKIWSHCLIDELGATVKNIKPQYSVLDIFVDRELDPTRQLTPFLKRKIESSALLLIVMSPFYLESA